MLGAFIQSLYGLSSRNALPVTSESSGDDGQQILTAVINVAVIITIVIAMTILLVCLFKFKCYKASIRLLSPGMLCLH